jgi:hypothetical protein
MEKKRGEKNFFEEKERKHREGKLIKTEPTHGSAIISATSSYHSSFSLVLNQPQGKTLALFSLFFLFTLGFCMIVTIHASPFLLDLQ